MASKTLVALLLVLLLIGAYFMLKDPILNAAKSIINIGQQTGTCGAGGDCSDSPITKNEKVVVLKTIVTKPNVVSEGVLVDVNTYYFGSAPQSSRDDTTIDRIVLHHTGGNTALAAMNWWKTGKTASAHYVIDRDGTIYYVVDEVLKAWHAGCCKQSKPDCCDAGINCPVCTDDKYYNMNQRSIGIELVNPGCDEFTEAQYASLNALIKAIIARHPAITLDNAHILAHFEIRQGKPDPTYTFEWAKINLPEHNAIAKADIKECVNA